MRDSSVSTSNTGTENHYSCEFTSMADPDTSQSQSAESTDATAVSDGVSRVVEEFRALTVEDGIVSPEPLLRSLDLEGLAEYIKEHKVNNVVCMVGAGISVNAGIPDFRSPGTGLFSRLRDLGLTTPEDVFDIRFFRENPNPFYKLAKELLPGKFQPTKAHRFMKLLQDKGLLLRCYSQNIDSLETQAGLKSEKLVPAHGNFDKAHCIDCKKEADLEDLKEQFQREEVMKCRHCEGFIKPDIVFYGESLPERFFECAMRDFDKCDLLIVMGSSLVVQPFCLFVDHVSDETPRLLINKEWAKGGYGESDSGFQRGVHNTRDIFYQGDCDEGVSEFASLMGLVTAPTEMCLSMGIGWGVEAIEGE